MELGLVKAARVRRGDTVAVVSPSEPVVDWWEHRGEHARAYLESLGLVVRVMPGSGADRAGTPVSPRSRAEDLNCGRADPMLTLPLGARARVDATAKALETLEPAVTPG